MTTKNLTLHAMVKAAIKDTIYSYSLAMDRTHVFKAKVAPKILDILKPHMNARSRNSTYRVYAKNGLSLSTFGSVSYQSAFEGKLVSEGENWYLFKITGNQFIVMEKDAITDQSIFDGGIGDKFHVQPYTAKFIDGHPVNKPRTTEDGATKITLGGKPTISAGDEITGVKSSYLRELVNYLNGFVMADGMRNITGALIDAGLRESGVSFVDVADDDISETNPSIQLKLNNMSITIGYNSGHDTFVLYKDDQLVMDEKDNFVFTCLADTIGALINDDTWQHPIITPMKPKKLKKAA